MKLIVYPDTIAPVYGSFEALSTDDMYLEGWVYRTIDTVIEKMGKSVFSLRPLTADTVADHFNEFGWRGVSDVLIDHFNLKNLNIKLQEDKLMSLPGLCEKNFSQPENGPGIRYYVIRIKAEFLDNPFMIASILAHELCHVIYFEKIEDARLSNGIQNEAEKSAYLLEMEHTVDLLVFMFKSGEFQLRVARDKRITFGYFRQDLFERMQVIVSKKLDKFVKPSPKPHHST